MFGLKLIDWSFKMKPTLKNMGEFYGIHFMTVQNWKKTRPLLYEVILKHFIEVHTKNDNEVITIRNFSIKVD